MECLYVFLENYANACMTKVVKHSKPVPPINTYNYSRHMLEFSY